ncbi:hypothetical protein BDZ31_001649 [Conexibacter arvalis]|uniref:Uncharacterized protein n=1 Tax=Conexibacter arvalis TaxID=912552 RepID=A0A840IB66_9ACTN|nr:hypothetical protein [Conexibacter arvalis]
MPITRDFFLWVATTLRWVLGPGAPPPPAPVSVAGASA